MARQDAPAPADPVDPWLEGVPVTSRRLIEAAIDAFAQDGYHATTTRDIANRVGMSPAALYVHFPSKAALLGQISRLGHAAAADLVRTALASAPDPLGRLQAVAGRFAAWHAEHHRVARIVQNELAALLPEDREAVRLLRRQIEQSVGEVVRAGVAAGVMRAGDERAVARAVLSLSVDVARWYEPGGRETPEAIGALYAELAARMVGATPAGRAPGETSAREA